MYDLRLIAYDKALRLQNNLVSARIAGEIQDIILFLQHPSVLTIGATGSEENILISRELLASKGITIFYTDRGGDITYHGPGQLIGYPIIDLRNKLRGIHLFVRSLEEVVIRTLGSYAISAYHDSQYPGVWVEQQKICALGLRVTRGITKHGFALNVNTNLEYFTYINPCGITDRQVTSISRLLGYDIALRDVTSRLIEQFEYVFNMKILPGTVEELSDYYDR